MEKSSSMYAREDSVLGSLIELGFCSTHSLILTDLSSVKFILSSVYHSSNNLEPFDLLHDEQQQHILDLTLWPPLCFGRIWSMVAVSCVRCLPQ